MKKKRKPITLRQLELHFDGMLETVHNLAQLLESRTKREGSETDPHEKLIDRFTTEWYQFIGMMSALDAKIRIIKGKVKKEWLN